MQTNGIYTVSMDKPLVMTMENHYFCKACLSQHISTAIQLGQCVPMAVAELELEVSSACWLPLKRFAMMSQFTIISAPEEHASSVSLHCLSKFGPTST